MTVPMVGRDAALVVGDVGGGTSDGQGAYGRLKTEAVIVQPFSTKMRHIHAIIDAGEVACVNRITREPICERRC